MTHQDPRQAIADAREIRSRTDDPEMTGSSLLYVVVSKIVLGEDASADEQQFREVCDRTFGTKWSSSELDSWLQRAESATERTERLREMIALFEKHARE